jgi:hypothetical protein
VPWRCGDFARRTGLPLAGLAALLVQGSVVSEVATNERVEDGLPKTLVVGARFGLVVGCRGDGLGKAAQGRREGRTEHRRRLGVAVFSRHSLHRSGDVGRLPHQPTFGSGKAREIRGRENVEVTAPATVGGGTRSVASATVGDAALLRTQSVRWNVSVTWARGSPCLRRTCSGNRRFAPPRSAAAGP